MPGDERESPAPRVTVGRIVHYVLSESDAEQVNRRRVARPLEPSWVPGAQAHWGNPSRRGDEVPLLVVRVWPDEYQTSDGVNGQAFLDGNDVLWITSARQDVATEAGTWHWPERG